MLEIVVGSELRRPRAWVDGAVHDAFEDGRLTIADLAPGPHTVLVGADDHEGKVLVIVLHEDETRRVEIFLRPKKPGKNE